MKNENNSFVHDTINLEEIRGLLKEDPEEAQDTSGMQPQTEAPVSEDSEEEALHTARERRKGLAYEFYEMLHDLIYILAAVALLFVFVVRLVGVDGDSMLPTLHNRDFLLLESNFLYEADDIEYGDVVVLNVPYYWERDKALIVKRVIATEGQTVDINYETGEVFVDGVCLEEDYINEPTYFHWEGDYALELPATVPEGHIFVLGDNRNNSSDSRFAMVGMIDERCVLGKAWAIALPGQTLDQWGNPTEERDWTRIGLVS